MKIQDSVGCGVPRCDEKICNRTRKGICALRRYYLLNVVRIRKLVYTHEKIMGRTEFRRIMYFWRVK